MADTIIEKDGGGGGGNTVLAFIVGAVLVAVGIVAFFMYNGHGAGPAKPAASLNIDVNKR
jgi:hypothetical protein